MNIVIDARMLLAQITGVGRYILGLAQEYRHFSDHHHFEFWIQDDLPADNPIWDIDGNSISLRELPLTHMNIRQQWVLPIELLRQQPDLLHYPHFDLPLAVPNPVVVTIHDLKYITRPDFFPQLGQLKRFLMLAMMSYTVRRAKRIIAVSNSTKSDILRKFKIPPEKIAVIPEGVDQRYFAPPRQEKLQAVLDRYQLANPFILFVGERRPHKNISCLLRSYSLFHHQSRGPYHLVIAGKGYANYREPERLTEALDLNEYVHFIDYVPDEDLPYLYHAANAFALLSLYEGFGLPVLEAMASGTPVVGANCTSLPEVIGEAGLLVSPDNPDEIAHALKLATTDNNKRQELIERGLNRARMFTWERCAKTTVDLYNDILQ